MFFVYNNPTDLLCEQVQRSREIIQAPGVTCLDLTTGPMAITGSTRMQATTVELLVVGYTEEVSEIVAALAGSMQPVHVLTLGPEAPLLPSVVDRCFYLPCTLP